jgi:hypothetical protein
MLYKTGRHSMKNSHQYYNIGCDFRVPILVSLGTISTFTKNL